MKVKITKNETYDLNYSVQLKLELKPMTQFK